MPNFEMEWLRKLIKCVGQTGINIQSWLTFPVQKSDVVLFRGVTHLLEWREPREDVVAPCPRKLAGDPGMRCLTDRDRSVNWLVWRDDHRFNLSLRLAIDASCFRRISSTAPENPAAFWREEFSTGNRRIAAIFYGLDPTRAFSRNKTI